MTNISSDKNGTFRIPLGKTFLQAELALEHGGETSVWRPAPGKGGLDGAAGPWSASLSSDDAGGGMVRLAVRVKPSGDRLLTRLYLRCPGARGAVPALDSPGTQMLAIPANPAPDGVFPLGQGKTVQSQTMTLLVPDGDAASLLMGMADLPDDFTFFDSDGSNLLAGFRVNRALSAPVTFSLLMASGPDPFVLLDDYGTYLSRFARSSPPPLTGWNSWDYYWQSVSMQDVREEMEAIRKSPLRKNVRVIAIDSGWQSAFGDWYPNRNFPASLRKIADEIKAASFVPGIWITPLLVNIDSRLGRHRQDIMACKSPGVPVLSGGHLLMDFTQTEALGLLLQWCQRLRKAGFEFFKIDYVYQDTIDKITAPHDPMVGRAAMIRRGLQIIRDAVGEKSHIMNVYAPTEAALGIADSARSSMDIHNFWGHIKANASQTAARLWQNGRLWRIDPDFAIVRARNETTSDRHLNVAYTPRPYVDGQWHWLAGPESPESELHAWLTLVHLSAGNVFLGDSVARLNAHGIARLAQLFPPLEQSARPLDLFINRPPRFWLADTPQGQRLGIFNWDDEEAGVEAPRGIDLPGEGRDVWTEKKITLKSTTRMPPHSAMLLEI